MPDIDLDFLAPLDPALGEEPPAPGSARYDAIRARALPQTAATGSRAAATGTRVVPPVAGRKPRRWPAWAAAGTAVAASVVATVVVLGGDATSAAAAVTTAAERTAEVVTLRGTVVSAVAAGGGTRTTIEVNGENSKTVTDYGDAVVTFTVVDGTAYETNTDGTPPSTTPLSPQMRKDPFGLSAAGVVKAALTGADVEEEGSEQVRGAGTTHYRVAMTAQSRAALAALPPTQTAWFELEHPEEITSLEVWTGDDLIRRVRVAQTDRVSTTEFYDFGAPVTVTAP